MVKAHDPRESPMNRIAAALLTFALAASTVPAAELASGDWTKKSFKIAGSWRIVEEDGQRFLELDAAFKTKKAPDLKLFLSRQALADATGKNATRDALLIAPLDSHQGAQRYKLPDVELNDYPTLLLHCEKYSKLWGGAPLR